MPRALWTLILLNFNGVRRRMLRGIRTPRGFMFLALGVLVILSWLGPSVYAATHGARLTPRTDPRTLRIVAPFAILGFCLGNLFASFGENAVAFTAAEVDFLFPGPFSRRSLLGFKIIKTAMGTVVTALVFSALMLRYGGRWLACFIGIWLTIQFMQLFAMAVVMVGQTIGERAYGMFRKGVVLLIVLIVIAAAAPKLAAGMSHDPMELMRQVHGSVAGRILLAPFDIFARTVTAGGLYPELAQWGALALMIDVLLFAVVIGLDANYLETAATVSQRRYERLHRVRRGGISGMAGRGTARFRVKPLPWLGGAGPIAWRQLTGAVRSSRGMFILLAIMTIGGGGFFMGIRGEKDSGIGPLFGAVVWINLLLVSMLKFDFRDELDRLDLLRSLPIRPAAVAAAEMVVPVLLLTAVQLLILVAGAWRGLAPAGLLLTAAAFAVPFNLLLVGIENLLFLMFPLRSVGLIAGDMQMVGRQMVIFFCKFLLLLSGLAVSAAVGLIGFILGGKSWPAFGAVMWVALSGVSVGTIPLVARRYSRFDPSVDTPP